MSEANETPKPKYREGLINAVSAGFFFILVGIIFMATPDLFEKIIAFFKDFKMVNVPNTNIFMPAPANPWKHLTLYTAAVQFSLVWGIFEIAILILRFFVHSPLSKKAETASNVVFWLGASFIIGVFLNETAKITEWFVFWSAILMLIGFTLILRATILATIKIK
ncbi:MAG: hypothetical protein QXN87_01560 [Candidatus Bathyarchaeia archaeon]